MEVLLNVLFPKKCVHCGVTGGYLCESCLSHVSFLSHQYCPACKESSVMGYSSHGCNSKTYLDQLYSVCWYRDAVVSLVGALKYNRPVRKVLEVFEMFIEGSVISEIGYDWEQVVYIPIPLHVRKHRERGFNQSELLATILSKHLGGTVCTDMVVRKINTKSQASLPKGLRKDNMKGAFEWTEKYIPQKTSHIVLVDDVYTSGSTLNECARIIKEAGVKTVSAFTFARG